MEDTDKQKTRQMSEDGKDKKRKNSIVLLYVLLSKLA